MNKKKKEMKTKNSKKNSLRKTMSCFFIIAILFFSNCNKEDNPTDCGCNSEIIMTITESDEQTGTISYKRQLDPKDNYYNEKFWIGYIDPNCSTCIHSYIVCNEQILNEFNYLISANTNETVNIKFAGSIREICEKSFNSANLTYNRITLTKIKLQ
jgi:hypothetical protein|tara:strand:- start:212 stop:679 length:468 start_codon:yes stop_codon:yes gene_type:complete